MSNPFSVGSVIEKNKLTSNVAFVVLLDIYITNPNTRAVEQVVSVAANDEPILFDGKTYQPGNFGIDVNQSQNEQSTVTLSAHDPTGFIANKLEAMAGGVFSKVTLTVVNTARLDRDPEMQESFEVLTSSIQDYVLTADLGSANPLKIAYPKHKQRRGVCAWRYKGFGCGYVGALETCDYTRDGPNGCTKHFSGKLPFRGLPGLVPLNL